MTTTPKTLVIIDAHALIHRAYHALPASLTSPRGEPLNAVYGFTSVLIKVLKELSPTHVVAAFDVARPTFRHKEFAEYKATRKEADTELRAQIPVVKNVLESFGIPVLEKEGFEADDVIGTVVEQVKGTKDLRVVVVTGDLDTLQLVDGDRVQVYTLRRGVTDTSLYNEKAVRERFGDLSPTQLTDYKGLKGDPSDNIPGVPGVGEKTAIALLSEHETVENLYAHLDESPVVAGKLKEKLETHRDQAFFSKQLATIRKDVPISFSLEEAGFVFAVRQETQKLFAALGFKSLLRRLENDTQFETGQKSAPLEETDAERFFREGVLSEKVYQLEKKLEPVLRHIEKTGFRIDVRVLTTLSAQFDKELTHIEKKAVSLAGEEFNLNSPQEVGRILFDVLELGGSKVKKTKTGQYSTAAAELEKVQEEHPIVGLMLKWRELSKLKSTYLDTLPELVDAKDGRIHTTFKQFGAATGRLSSENPNLQNIPIRGTFGKDIRKAFVARDGYCILAADYSQLELRIAAALSKDKIMMKAFAEGEDIHTRTAAEVFGVPPTGVTRDMRRQAKVLNFGVLYGMGPRAFSQAADIPFEQAKKFITAYKSEFEGLWTFLEETKARAYTQGYVETVWGRKRFLPELSSNNPGIQAAGERIAMNMPIQGTGADIIKAAMVEIDGHIRDNADVYMILQVHDELVFEVKRGVVDAYAPRIAERMTGVITLDVPLVVDVEVGPSWGEMKRIAGA